MSETNFWRAAHLVMKHHGDDAALVATVRANALLAEGDTVGCSLWIGISRAIKELRLELTEGNALH